MLQEIKIDEMVPLTKMGINCPEVVQQIEKLNRLKNKLFKVTSN